MTPEQLTALFGEAPRFSDNKIGDTITYRRGSQEVTDTIMWIIAPTIDSSMCYVMTEPDPDNSLPALVYPSQIVEALEPAMYKCLKCGQHHYVGLACPLA